MKPCHIFVEKFLICYELVCDLTAAVFSVSVLSLLRQYSNCPRINNSSHELRIQAAVFWQILTLVSREDWNDFGHPVGRLGFNLCIDSPFSSKIQSSQQTKYYYMFFIVSFVTSGFTGEGRVRMNYVHMFNYLYLCTFTQYIQ